MDKLLPLGMVLLFALHAGCNSCSNNTGPLEGKVIDGYLVNARVYQDLNGNEIWDVGEPYAFTDTLGHYSLRPIGAEANLKGIVVEIIPGETYDSDRPNTPIENLCVLEVPIGHHIIISPFTTLATNWMAIRNITREEAEEEIRVRFDLSPDFDFNTDYIGASGEYVKARSVAQAIGEIMMGLFGKIEEGLNGEIGGDAMPKATQLVTWRVMEKAEAIAEAVGTGWTPENAAAIVVPFLFTEDNLEGMTSAQSLDVSSPSLIRCTPESGDVVPCQTSLTLVFDEEINTTSITNAIRLLNATGTPITSSTQWDSATHTLTLTPLSPLFTMQSYTVSVAASVADTSGNPLGKTLRWTFQTNTDLFPPAPPTL